jgi:hypothetical protein
MTLGSLTVFVVVIVAALTNVETALLAGSLVFVVKI